MLFVPEWRRSRRTLDVRAADLQEEMAEQRSYVPSAPTKTAATKRTSQRAAASNRESAIRASGASNQQGLKARQALQEHVDGSRQPAGDAERK